VKALDLDQIDRDALAERLRDRDRQREPRLSRRHVARLRRLVFAAWVVDTVADSTDRGRP
jgi:hypothetical protein